jgi:hypothetical protein
MDEASRFGAQVRALVGSQRASFAGQGVDVGSGSAADVQADAAYLGELDKRQILSNAQREAWGYRVDAENNRRNADIARKGGAAAQSASRWGAASTALGATSSFLIQKYGWERTPAPRRA